MNRLADLRSWLRAHLPEAALVLVLAIGFAARAWVVLLPPCLPGEDGAYYLVQVRGLLREGSLPVADFPLVFHAMAALARLLGLVMAPEAAIEVAVRGLDTFVPLLLALPVYGFARSFVSAKAARGAAVLLAGLLAVASGNLLVMAAGMIKNGAALPFSLGFLYFTHRGLGGSGRPAWLAAALCLVIASLTHLSALVLNLGFIVVAALAWMGLRRSLWPLAGLAFAAGALIGLPFLEPERGARLLEAVLHPAGWFRSGQEAAYLGVEVWLGNALGLLGGYARWRYRAALEDADKVLLVACASLALGFSCPLLRPDLLERLALVALVPGLVPLVFLVGRQPAAAALAVPLVLVAGLHGYLAAKTLRVTGLVRPAWEELASLRDGLPPGRNLVMVRHGLEWWVVWALDAHYSNGAGRALGDREAYDALLLVEEIRPGAFGGGWSKLGNPPGASLRDGHRLQGARFQVLGEGHYFRLLRWVPDEQCDDSFPGPDPGR